MATLLLALVLSLATAARCQVPVAPERNPAGVLPNFFTPGDAAANALFPLSILAAETAVSVRHGLMFTTVQWNFFGAACDPRGVALNFWGERETVDLALCTDPAATAEAYAYGQLRVHELEYPESFRLYGDLMAANGYDPADRSTNMSTGVGVGNAMGMRVATWFASDGWNALGDRTREHFRQPYEDFTGYAPVNSPWELTHPLRWQPLTQHRGNGRYAVQSHAVPFFGRVAPLVLSQEDFEARQTPSPYLDINATTMDPRDADTVDALVLDVFGTSANLTFEQRLQARWFEFKGISIASFSALQAIDNGWFEPQNLHIILRYFLGESLSFHDGLLLAWKEKRRHDAVRPDTVIDSRFRGEKVKVWVNDEGGVREIAAKDWEPLIPTQAHSDYPSASAALCNASAQHADFFVRELLGDIRPVVTVDLPRQALFPDSFFKLIDMEGRNATFVYETYEDVSRACGESRLWAGVHFGPSVPAGWALADGVGRAAYEHVKDLVEGRVPADCTRCT